MSPQGVLCRHGGQRQAEKKSVLRLRTRTVKGNRKLAQNTRPSVQQTQQLGGKLYQSLSGTFQEQMCKLAVLVPVFSTFQHEMVWVDSPNYTSRLAWKLASGCQDVCLCLDDFFTRAFVLIHFISTSIQASPAAKM